MSGSGTNVSGFDCNTLQHEQRVCGTGKLQGNFSLARAFMRVVLFLFAGLLSFSAHANLTCDPTGLSNVLAAGTISVPVNAAAGTTVSTLAPVPFGLRCFFSNSGSYDTSATEYADFKTTTPLAPGFADVYQTGIAGLGIRYTFNSAKCDASNVVLANGAVRLSCPFTGPLGGAYMPADGTVTISLIVTGAIAPGASSLTTVPVVTTGLATSDGGSGYWGKSGLFTGSATGILTRATCSVSRPSVSVLLPTADTRAFSAGVGATAAPTPFSLSFACSSGAKVSITLTDNVNPSNVSNVLQLTADSTAKGVGIQVLNSTGSPVSFGPDSATPGNTNQWLIGASPNGPLQVPLTARYVRTASVSAGTVKALATFTMSYQ